MSMRRTLAAICLVPLLLVAACSADEPEPKIATPTPSPSTSPPTPSPTPTVDPLAIPAAAKEPTKAGAEALVRHFWDMVNHLIETGDAKPVRRLYGISCDFCKAGVDSYEAVLERGHTLEGGKETVARIRVSVLGSLNGFQDASADVTVRSSAQTERDAEGIEVNKFPRGSTVKRFFLAYQDGQWGVTNVEDVKQ